MPQSQTSRAKIDRQVALNVLVFNRICLAHPRRPRVPLRCNCGPLRFGGPNGPRKHSGKATCPVKPKRNEHPQLHPRFRSAPHSLMICAHATTCLTQPSPFRAPVAFLFLIPLWWSICWLATSDALGLPSGPIFALWVLYPCAILCGMAAAKCRLPPLLGMLLAGLSHCSPNLVCHMPHKIPRDMMMVHLGHDRWHDRWHEAA